jgi:hypothetical protein
MRPACKEISCLYLAGEQHQQEVDGMLANAKEARAAESALAASS